MQDSILTTVVKDIDGEVTTLEKYAGNVLLIVNVASKCGLTPQYEQLENIQKAGPIVVLWCWDSRATSFWSKNRVAMKRLKLTAPLHGGDVPDVQ